ncbi:uncharacterized protein DS421_6g192180 [Arachis hypogaea]|nr:uncharacterized protein DS421_6g192180 [Arachis hypogaea]
MLASGHVNEKKSHGHSGATAGESCSVRKSWMTRVPWVIGQIDIYAFFSTHRRCGPLGRKRYTACWSQHHALGSYSRGLTPVQDNEY